MRFRGVLERFGGGLGHRGVLLLVAAADADRTDDLAVALERDAAREDHDLALVGLLDAVERAARLGIGSELGAGSDTSSNSDLIRALRRGSSDSVSQTGQKGVQRNLNIQPTLTIRPGFPVRVIVNRDLVLEPYRV